MARNNRDGRGNFTSDDRTYSMNDRNYDPVYAGRNDGGFDRGENRFERDGNRFQRDDYAGPRSGGDDYSDYQGYAGQQGGRRSSSMYGAGSSSTMDQSRSERGMSDSGYGSSYYGRPGLSGSSSAPSIRGNDGYRAYQDYGSSERSGSTQGHAGKGPKGYRRSDDKIHDEVCELLTSHYDIDASEIEVEVKEGVVTLGGTVESRRTKRMAEDVVADLNGVVDVRNNLHILSHDSSQLQSSGSSQMDTKGYRSPGNSTDSTLSGARAGKTSSTTSSTNRQ